MAMWSKSENAGLHKSFLTLVGVVCVLVPCRGSAVVLVASGGLYGRVLFPLSLVFWLGAEERRRLCWVGVFFRILR